MSSPSDRPLDAEPCRTPSPAQRLSEVRDRLDVVQKSIRVISGKWKWEILCLLIDGPKRFNELRRSIPGITQHMLAAQLKDMEAAGLVERRAYREMPPRVEYEMTPAGRELKPVAEALFAWGERHASIEAPPPAVARPLTLRAAG